MKWFVPGRLEVFGKHTDYAGGRSLLAAVDCGITVHLTQASEHITIATDAVAGELKLAPGSDPKLPAGHWGRYVQSVLDRLSANFGPLAPCHIAISSNLPLASGMSSSSALVVAVALALIDHNGFRETPQWRANIVTDADLAGYLATTENGLTYGTLLGQRSVGTFGGSEDHTAMLCCTEGELSEFTFCPIVEHRSVALPPEWSFVVGVSGVLAEKTGAALEAYNNASLTVRKLVERWNVATGRDDAVLADALASSEDALAQLHAITAQDPALTSRLTAFITESEVVIPQAVAALEAGDLESFGDAADLSHRNASEALGNQVPETNRLQALARELGAVAATGFGAGFGGSVWALVHTDEATSFAQVWLERYLAEFPDLTERASTIVTRPGGPARRL